MRTNLFNLLSLIFCLFFSNSYCANYYVSSAGNDNNNGLSASAPFKTIQKASNLTNPGDIVYVMNGTYTNSCSVCDVINITRSGTPASWIRYTNYPGHNPKLKFNAWQGVKVYGASYIEISGFDIEGNNANITLAYAQSQAGNVNNPSTSGNGIYIENNGTVFSHHVKISGNKIHDCGGHGIGSHWADYITIYNNTIYNNAWYSPLGCSGISLYQNKNFDSYSGYRIFISNNQIYNNQMFIPFFYNGKIEDGNGMIIDDARNTQNGSPHGKYNGSIRVENNIVFDNGGRGIHAFYSDNMDAINNTCYQNCKSPEVKDGELTAYATSNVRFYNNATYSRSDARANHDGDGTSSNVVFNYNIYYNFNAAKKITKGPNDIVADPKFVSPTVNPLLANFRLQPASPGIDKGTATLASGKDIVNTTRPSGTGFDIGAYEFVSSPKLNIAPSINITTPAANTSFTAGSNITIGASAADSDGKIAKVEFFQGAIKLGEDLTAPYTFTWTAVPAGTYRLEARATDDSNTTSISSAVTISVTTTPVNISPTITITSPAQSGSFPAGGSVVINATATDADGMVNKVEFFQGVTKLGEDLTSPYTFTWGNLPIGNHSLTAIATDNQGATTTSVSVNITVQPITPPSGCISKPIPSSIQWAVKNNWGDQNNGSGVANTTEALVITHRQWGNNYLWVVETGASYDLIAGKEYTVSFDYKDDPANRIASVEVGFAKSHDWGGVALWQPAVMAPVNYSSSAYTTKTIKVSALFTGKAYLSLKLNWAAQPNLQVENYLKNLSFCEANSLKREIREENNLHCQIYPNPSSGHTVLHVAANQSGLMMIRIFDITGTKISEVISETNKEEVIGENLKSGLYLIEAIYGDKKELVKFRKE